METYKVPELSLHHSSFISQFMAKSESSNSKCLQCVLFELLDVAVNGGGELPNAVPRVQQAQEREMIPPKTDSKLTSN